MCFRWLIGKLIIYLLSSDIYHKVRLLNRIKLQKYCNGNYLEIIVETNGGN